MKILHKLKHLLQLQPCRLVRVKETQTDREHLLLECAECGEMMYLTKYKVGAEVEG